MMPRPPELSEAQRRHLTIVLQRLAEESRAQQKRWAAGGSGPRAEQVAAELKELRRAASGAARALGLSLDAGPPDPSRRLAAWSATWWTHVLDARPSALRRFGHVDARASETIGPLVEDLANRLRRLQVMAEENTDEGSRDA
jgi:hypothetical protein